VFSKKRKHEEVAFEIKEDSPTKEDTKE